MPFWTFYVYKTLLNQVWDVIYKLFLKSGLKSHEKNLESQCSFSFFSETADRFLLNFFYGYSVSLRIEYYLSFKPISAERCTSRIIIIFYFFPLCSFKNTYKPKFLLFHNQRLPLNSHVSNFIIFFPIHNNNLYYFSSYPVHPINTTE